MSTPSEIILELQSQLKLSSDLSSVDNSHIYLGIRDNIINFPSIVIEPLRVIDNDLHYSRQDMDLHIAVMGFVSHTGDKDDLIADSSIDGILNLENRVKQAIEDDRTLGGKAIHINYVETVYDYSNYPVRNFGIEIVVRFRQTTNVRT